MIQSDILKSVEWFSFKIDGTIELSETASKTSNIIYIFKNVEQNKYLIGKTGNSLQIRLNNYLNNINNSSIQSEFLKDIRQDPLVFQLGILHVLSDDEDLDQLEVQFITAMKANQLYNQNKGGGGGVARQEEEPVNYEIPDSPSRLTPIKRYPFNKDIKPQFSPTAYKSVPKTANSSQIYSILEKSTGQRYIGTSYNFINRSRQHGYAASHGKSELLHRAMKKNPTDFSVGLIPIRANKSIRKKKGYVVVSSLGEAETLVIKTKRTLFPNGLNSNQGGGGPIARQNNIKLRS